MMSEKRGYVSPGANVVTAHLDDLMPLIVERLSAGQSVEFMPRGISMRPLLREGRDSVVLSSCQGRLKKFDIPLYRRRNGGYVLHRVVKVEDNSYTLIGDNQYIYEPSVTDSQIIAVVTAVRRGGRLIFPNNIIYRTYVSLWHSTRSLRSFCIRAARKVKRAVKKIISH